MIDTNMQFNDIYQALTELADQKEEDNNPGDLSVITHLKRSTMITRYITIEQEIGRIPTIKAQLLNGFLWLTKSQKADLLGAFTQKIEGCLKTGFSSGTMVEKDVCRVHR